MKWFYLCNRNDQCKRECSEGCYYTTDFFKSKVYRNPIKPATVLFVHDKQGNCWQIERDKSYPTPPLTTKNFECTYNDLECWVFKETAKKIQKQLGITITYADGEEKKF